MRRSGRPGSFHRQLLVGVCAATTLVAVALLAHTPPEAAAAPLPAQETAGAVSAEEEALLAAKRSGWSVEVAGSRSESSRLVATPEGSLRLESYAVPRWTKGQDGSWRQIDTRLRHRSDGAVAPVATLTDVSFSAGGTGAAVTLPVGGGRVDLSWPGLLPAPKVEGDTAVYESVLPDVDLRLRALVDGFTWVLVVKSAQAAAHPELESLRFRLDTTGLSKRTRTGGGFEVIDAEGLRVLSSGNAVMWDSSGLTPPAVSGENQALTEYAEQEHREALDSIPDTARKAELSTTVEGADLVIVPDPELLRGSNTVFPVMIDPWSTIEKIRWGYANETNSTRDDGVARVGKDPTGSGIHRSFFSFNLTSLSGKTIRSAKFLTEMTHSWDCSSTPVNLWRTADLTTTGKQTWDGPDLALWIEQRSGNAHKPTGTPECSNDPQPDLPMEFAATKLRDDIIANRGQAIYTLALSARQSDGTSEGTSNWWKKFDPVLTKLTIEYNTNPNTPTAAQLSTHPDYTAPGHACVTGTSRPMVRSDYPWLKATVTDPDGSNGGSLSGVFTLQKWNSTAWATVTGWPRTDSGIPSGAKAEVQLTTKTTDGEQYRWQVQTKDSLGGASALSPWCEFHVDYAAPAATPAVTSGDGLYLESPPQGSNQDVRGSVGYSGRFTFSANGATDVYDYVYQVDGGAEMIVRAPTLGGSATVWVTPKYFGENVLTVRSRDQAGNSSAKYDYVFLVDSPSEMRAAWVMNEGTGASLTNKITGASAATLTNGPGWLESRTLGAHEQNGKDWAVNFDGTDDHAVTSGPVVDTSRSFSVSAWVKADSIVGSRVVLSQPGTNKSPFELQYVPTQQKWCFVTYASDTVNGAPTAQPACSSGTARTGVWTHLTAVYDVGSPAQPLSLYVNGTREGFGTSAPMWASSGPLTIAAARNGAMAAFFDGAIDDVRIWNRTVSPELDLVPLVAPVLTGQWEMEDYDNEAPRQEADGSGYQRPLNLTDAPTLDWSADGYNFSNGLAFDGVSGHAATNAPVIRTDQSYTVSAWVRWTGGSGSRTVIAQDGNEVSGFFLSCRTDTAGAKWSLMTRSIDSASSSARYAIGGPCVMDRWTHLAAVQDVAAEQLNLYIDGTLAASITAPPGWHANGTFTVGRAKWRNPADYWTGDIDRVRVWQGALTGPEIAALWAEQ